MIRAYEVEIFLVASFGEEVTDYHSVYQLVIEFTNTLVLLTIAVYLHV